MNIVLVGDKVNEGFNIIGIHSRFRHAINVYTDSGMLFFVSKGVGGGPNSIVFDADDLLDFHFDTYVLKDFSGLNRYSSIFTLPHYDVESFKQNLKLLKILLLEFASPLSCSFLIGDENLSDAKLNGNFQSALREKLKKGFKRLLEFDLNSIAELKGLGYGFTPQGDDLIQGFLAALFLYEKLYFVNTERLRKEILLLSTSSNEVVNTFLFYTAHGLFYERFKNVLTSLFTGMDIEQHLKNMLSFGETSGADILTGFIKGMERLLEGGH